MPVSTTNVDIASDHDRRRTPIGCVSGKLRDSPDLAIILGSVTIDMLSPTITACVGDIAMFGIMSVLAFAQDRTMLHE